LAESDPLKDALVGVRINLPMLLLMNVSAVVSA
jgi:hypothetical protein